MRVVLAVMVVGLVLAATAQGQVGAQMRLTARTVDVRETTGVRSDVLLLFNKNVRVAPIGHAVLSCFTLGTGGILGGGVAHCVATYAMPLGTFTAQGVLHSFRRYTLTITGGRGFYANASGYVFARRIGPGVMRLAVNL